MLKSEGLPKEGDFEALRTEGRDLAEANELLWEKSLERGFRAAGQTAATANGQKNSEQWKIRLAAEMKRRANAPNTRIARRLHMGAPHAVTIHDKAFECGQNGHSEEHDDQGF